MTDKELEIKENKKIFSIAIVSFTAGILSNMVTHQVKSGRMGMGIILALSGITATYFVLKNGSK